MRFFIDTSNVLGYNKVMNRNIEILNFLNLISPKLGKMYRSKGISPLPTNFELTEEKIVERLKTNQMREFLSPPNFAFADKKIIKEKIKNSIKNIKKILKNRFFVDFSENLRQKIEFYFKARFLMSKIILKEFDKYDFNETTAIEEIFGIDPVLSEFTESLFEENVDFDKLFADLEERYTLSYLEKIKILEKRAKKEKAKTQKVAIAEHVEKTAKTKEKTSQKSKVKEKEPKIEEKTEKNVKKHAKSEDFAKDSATKTKTIGVKEK